MRSPTGKLIEVIGLSIATVNNDLKIEKVEHFFDSGDFLKELTAGKCPVH